MSIERVDERFGAVPVLWQRDAELLANRRQEFDGRQLRIQDQRDIDFGGNLAEQRADQCRLAGPDLAG